VPYSYGFAILFLTLLVKAVTFPLTKKQVEGSIQMQAIQVSVFPIYRIPPTDHSPSLTATSHSTEVLPFPIYRIPPTDHSPSLTATSHSTEVLPTSNVLTTGNSYQYWQLFQINHKCTVCPYSTPILKTQD
jgi:hypothetical protein